MESVGTPVVVVDADGELVGSLVTLDDKLAEAVADAEDESDCEAAADCVPCGEPEADDDAAALMLGVELPALVTVPPAEGVGKDERVASELAVAEN